jgi:hypothetical protein
MKNDDTREKSFASMGESVHPAPDDGLSVIAPGDLWDSAATGDTN